VVFSRLGQAGSLFGKIPNKISACEVEIPVMEIVFVGFGRILSQAISGNMLCKEQNSFNIIKQLNNLPVYLFVVNIDRY
jgi:hypothetical protein